MLVDFSGNFAEIKPGDRINLISWMNFKVCAIDLQKRMIDLEALPEDRDFKSVLKLNYVNSQNCVPLVQFTYGDLLTKAVLSKDDDFKQFINREPAKQTQLLGESAIKSLNKSDAFQIYRHGLVIVDDNSNADNIQLIKIPEGKLTA